MTIAHYPEHDFEMIQIVNSYLGHVNRLRQRVGAHVRHERNVCRNFRDILELDTLHGFVDAVVAVIRLGIEVPFGLL